MYASLKRARHSFKLLHLPWKFTSSNEVCFEELACGDLPTFPRSVGRVRD